MEAINFKVFTIGFEHSAGTKSTISFLNFNVFIIGFEHSVVSERVRSLRWLQPAAACARSAAACEHGAAVCIVHVLEAVVELVAAQAARFVGHPLGVRREARAVQLLCCASSIEETLEKAKTHTHIHLHRPTVPPPRIAPIISEMHSPHRNHILLLPLPPTSRAILLPVVSFLVHLALSRLGAWRCSRVPPSGHILHLTIALLLISQGYSPQWQILHLTIAVLLISQGYSPQD